MKAATANFPELPLARSKTAPSLTSGKVVGKRICPVREERGFTLLELTVVLALIALMLGLVVPNLYGSWRREQDRAAVRQMMAAMRTARSLAATRHRRVRVFFDLVKGRYQLEGSPQSVDVSRNFRLGEAHLAWQDREARRGYVAFYGDGSSSGGYLALVDRGGKIQVLDVEILTGRVSLKTTG